MVLQMQMSAEEFLTLVEQHPAKRFGFIDGEIVEVSPKPVHGQIQAEFTFALMTYIRQHPLGVVYTEVLHVLGDEKFIPDIAINQASVADYLTEPPLLAVEIRSDTQSQASQRRKAESYIQHGTRLVILVFPYEGVEIYRPGQETLICSPENIIDGGEVLPGFSLPVSAILGGE